MPLTDTTVGPLVIPAPVGATDEPLAESTTDFLLDYVRFWFRWGLNEKLATMTAPPVRDAVPVGNAYTNAPSAVYLQRALPALFVYWSGTSGQMEYSTVRDLRWRDFHIMYVFERVLSPDGVKQWSGLVSTLDALLQKAFSRRAHRLYGANGFGPGTDVRFMFKWKGLHFTKGSEGMLQELPEGSMRGVAGEAGAAQKRAKGAIQQGYPSYMAIVRIWEEIGLDTMVDPDDVMHDVPVTMSAGEGPNEVEPDTMTGVLIAPDGTNEPPETI